MPGFAWLLWGGCGRQAFFDLLAGFHHVFQAALAVPLIPLGRSGLTLPGGEDFQPIDIVKTAVAQDVLRPHVDAGRVQFRFLDKLGILHFEQFTSHSA